MPIADALLPEFDHEMATTRRLLERLPEAEFAWKPHDRSMALGQLAGHIANRDLSVGEMFDRYEGFMYRQWLRVYMRTQTIHHNKELLQSVGDDRELLAKLHVY